MVIASLSALALNVHFGALLTSYILLVLSYSLGLKHHLVVDVLVIAAGFVLRLVAGAVVTGSPLCPATVLLVLFGALLAATTKRSAEKQRYSGTDVPSLTVRRYPFWLLDALARGALVCLLMTYLTWVLLTPKAGWLSPVLWISCASFLFCLLRYRLLTYRGYGEFSEDLLSDPLMFICGFIWILTLMAGVHAPSI